MLTIPATLGQQSRSQDAATRSPTQASTQLLLLLLLTRPKTRQQQASAANSNPMRVSALDRTDPSPRCYYCRNARLAGQWDSKRPATRMHIHSRQATGIIDGSNGFHTYPSIYQSPAELAAPRHVAAHACHHQQSTANQVPRHSYFIASLCTGIQTTNAPRWLVLHSPTGIHRVRCTANASAQDAPNGSRSNRRHAYRHFPIYGSNARTFGN